MKKNIALTLNGKKTVVGSQKSVQDIIDDYKLKKELVAVEVNGIFIEKKLYAKRMLKNDDIIEIIKMMGGGGSIGK